MEEFFQVDSVTFSDKGTVIQMHCVGFGPMELSALTLVIKGNVVDQWPVGREYQVTIQQPIPA
jgi:hypothetical protein